MIMQLVIKEVNVIVNEPEKYNYFTIRNMKTLFKKVLINSEEVKSDVESEEFGEKFDKSNIYDSKNDDTNIYIREILEVLSSESQSEVKSNFCLFENNLIGFFKICFVK